MPEFIYFMQAGKGGPIKIGKTHNLEQRLASIQVGNPLEVKVLFACSMKIICEDDLHKMFREYKLNGEWFIPHGNILKKIKELMMRALDDNFNLPCTDKKFDVYEIYTSNFILKKPTLADKIIETLKRREPLTHRDLTRAIWRGTTKQQRKMVIDELIDSNKITIAPRGKTIEYSISC